MSELAYRQSELVQFSQGQYFIGDKLIVNMLISTIFIAFLVSTLYRSSNTLAVSGLDTSRESPSARSDDENSTLNLNNVQQRFDYFLLQLKKIDTSLQELHEKSNTWSIFRHNIDAWNAQMLAIEHKLMSIKNTQDEHQHKLTSLELTLNHVLSKVVFLSDADVHRTSEPMSQRDRDSKDSHQSKHSHLDKRIIVELSARLNNVLRHLQTIEGRRCRGDGSVQETSLGVTDGKVGNIMLPKTTSKIVELDLDKILRKLEQKMNILLANLQPKDLKQMMMLTKKNAKNLEGILTMTTHLMEQQKKGANSWDQMTDYCQAVSGELTTFTESSDLLLKRIEIVVKDVSDKLKVASKCGVNGTDEDDDGLTEISPLTENPVVNDTENDDSNESDDHVEVVEFVQPTKSDCFELTEPRVDGIYKFKTPEFNEAQRDFNERFCAFATDGGAWTVIQNRGPFLEQENFNRSWNDYRTGFGSLAKDFWFGNEFIRILANRDDYVLRIELEDFDGMHVWSEYESFRLDSESYNYNLMIDNYRGSIPDAMHYHNEMDFSTFDHRNDRSSGEACAVGYGGGWWFDNCSETNLNGIYHDSPNGHNYVGIIWEHWHGDYSLKATRMLIRPKNSSLTLDERKDPTHIYFNEFTDN